jgi:hypothetical protein
MCEWEQECSDNPLLFNPDFACQFIKERVSHQQTINVCKMQIATR